MSILGLINGLIIGVFLITGILSALLIYKDINKKLNYLFLLVAFFTIGSLIVAYNKYFCVEVDTYIFLHKLEINFARFIFFPLLLLISHLTKFYSKKFIISIFTLIVFLYVLNFINPYGSNWNIVYEMKKSFTLWGEQIYVPIGTLSNWYILVALVNILAIVYTISGIITLFKTNEKTKACILGSFLLIWFLTIITSQVLKYFYYIQLIRIYDFAFVSLAIFIALINLKSLFRSFEIQASLNNSEQKYKAFVDGINEIIFKVDRYNRVEFANNKFYRIFELSEEEVVGKDVDDIDFEKSKVEFRELQTKLFSSKTRVQSQLHVKTKRGKKFTLLISLDPIIDEKNNFDGAYGFITDLTKSHEVEESFKRLVEGAPFAVNSYEMVDGEIYFRGYNKASAKIGLDYEYVMNKAMTKYWMLSFNDEYLELANGLANGKINQRDVIARFFVGDEEFIIHNYFFHTGANKWSSFQIDVTERKKSEEKIERERLNFIRVFEESAIAMEIVEQKAPFKRLAINKAFQILKGCEKGELLNSNLESEYKEEIESLRRLVSVDDRKKIEKIYAKNRAVEDFPIQTKDQKYFLISVKQILFDEKKCNLLYLKEVTEIESTKRDLEDAFKYIQFLLESIDSSIIAVDDNFVVTHQNQAAYKFNHSQTEGNFIFDKFPQLRFIEKDLIEFTKTKAHYETSVKQFEHPIGESTQFQATFSKIKSRKKPGYLIVVEDITDRKKIEELMIQSEKMISVAGLAAGLAHEINNPLGTIVQGCQNLVRRTSEGLKKNEEIADNLGISISQIESYMKQREIGEIIGSMNTSAIKASEIIQNMLQFSRKSESNKVMYDLSKIINESLDLARSDYDMKKNFDFLKIKIDKNIPKDCPRINITVTEIQQVIFNILKNAAQALLQKVHTQEEHKISINVTVNEKFIDLNIEDNGPGISSENLKRIFEPFFTTKEVGEGTGLGLAVSYMIMKNNHDGDLNAVSELGKGTIFTLKFPV